MFPPPFPWKQIAEVDPDREYVAFASRFYLKSYFRVPGFMLGSGPIMKQLDAAPGIVGWAMAADIPRLQFHTISVWEDSAALRAFNTGGDHGTARSKFASAMKRGGTFVNFTVRGRDLPIDWPEALRRVDEQIARQSR